jgi:hypothetical protein
MLGHEALAVKIKIMVLIENKEWLIVLEHKLFWVWDVVDIGF